MNGTLTKILAGVSTSALAALLVAAVFGTYTVAGRLSSLEATLAIYMKTDSERHVELVGKVRDLERGRRYGPQ